MVRKIITSLFIGILAALMIPAVSLAATTQITTKADLLALADRVNKGNDCAGETFELTADIAVDGDWMPIGYTGYPFNGTFDGKGFKVTGYTSNAEDQAGFFNFIGNGGAVINTDFYGDISMHDTVFLAGGIAAVNYGKITNCSFSGSVSNANITGGLVGRNYGLVRNCFSSGTVAGDYAGGITGFNAMGTIKNCYSTSTVTGSAKQGGLVGRHDVEMINCYWLLSGCANGYGLNYGTGTNITSFSDSGTLANFVGGSNVLLDVLNAYAQPDPDLMVWVAGTGGYAYPVLEYGTYKIQAAPVNIDFGSATVGYTQPAAQTITVTNTGNKPVTIAQPTAVNYTVGMLSATTIVPAGTATFTVQPKAGLAVGTYDETISITGSNGVSASVQLRFTVTAATPAPTSTPTPTPTHTPTPVPYRVISGAGGTYHQQGPSGLTFTANGDFDHFTGIQVDGNPVDESDYDAREGSTIITLHPDYMDSLTVGTHQIRILFTDGYADASFTVAQELDPVMPPTGDNTEAAVWGTIVILCAAALALLLRRRPAHGQR